MTLCVHRRQQSNALYHSSGRRPPRAKLRNARLSACAHHFDVQAAEHFQDPVLTQYRNNLAQQLCGVGYTIETAGPCRCTVCVPDRTRRRQLDHGGAESEGTRFDWHVWRTQMARA